MNAGRLAVCNTFEMVIFHDRKDGLALENISAITVNWKDFQAKRNVGVTHADLS